MKSKKRKDSFGTRKEMRLGIKMCKRSLLWCKKAIQESLVAINEVIARGEIDEEDRVYFQGVSVSVSKLRIIVATLCRRADLDQRLLEELLKKYKK